MEISDIRKQAISDQFLIKREETVLVTGANGFVGIEVVRALLEFGFLRVRCLTRKTSDHGKLEKLAEDFGEGRVEILRGNLLSRDDCAIAVDGASVIYHLAAGVEKSFPGCFLNSVVTTRNLLEAAINQEGIKRFVNTSSIAVYSNRNIPRGGPLDETSEVDSPMNMVLRNEAYAYGKVKQDELVLDFAREKGLPLVIVRPGVVFGPGKAKITDRIGSDTFGIFLHLGLNNRIPLTYVENCAQAIALAGLREGIDGQILNIVDDDLPRSREFLKLYKREVRRFVSIPVPYPIWYLFCWIWEVYSRRSEGQLPPVFNRRTCEIYWKGNVYPNTKIRNVLEWEPRVPMDEALNRFFSYMREVDRKS